MSILSSIKLNEIINRIIKTNDNGILLKEDYKTINFNNIVLSG
jgi:hypothetical protein